MPLIQLRMCTCAMVLNSICLAFLNYVRKGQKLHLIVRNVMSLALKLEILLYLNLNWEMFTLLALIILISRALHVLKLLVMIQD